MTPTVTVLVPTYNRRLLLSRCLDSLLTQTHPPAQIVVVDDCSTDDTAEYLASLGGRVQALRPPRQGGKAAALNFALPSVVGDVLWVFDDDDVAYPASVGRIAAAFAAHPSASFVFGAKDVADGLPDGSFGPVQWTLRSPDVRGHAVFPRLLEGCFLGAARLAVRTSRARAVGGYSEALLRSQDYDFALRATRGVSGEPIEGAEALFLFRRHDGVRGPAADPHAEDQRRQRWLQYDQRIFQRLRSELLLEEYAWCGDGKSAPLPQRALLLRRGLMMSRRQLFAELVEDLDAAANETPEQHLSADEQALLERIVFDQPYYDQRALIEQPDAFESVRRCVVRYSPYRAALRAIAIRRLKAAVRHRTGVAPAATFRLLLQTLF
ncbi:MAG: glycosyltransferase family 2 protein [Gemmatimonadota bacterium]|nr:glycosyltransferase family 2 protein [Gemmatimonadota bacterium]MDQ8173242.1 glycosyltransferase family 2 protein [Gemmatimonadota bacterium]